jgi:hypothetical protein
VRRPVQQLLPAVGLQAHVFAGGVHLKGRLHGRWIFMSDDNMVLSYANS